MHKLLEHAISEAGKLPEAQQEEVARRILAEIEALMRKPAAKEGRWAEVARRRAETGAMRGESERFTQEVRSLRDTWTIDP